MKNCPVDAIDIENKTFDLDKCIGCYGYINRCPKHAITPVSDELEKFMNGFIGYFKNTRLEPEVFL